MEIYLRSILDPSISIDASIAALGCFPATSTQEECLYIAALLARSLILQSWRTEKVPTFHAWRAKLCKIQELEKI